MCIRTDGTFLGRVATHGRLNAPWGLAWAPANFGRFSNDLIVGNFGNGKLNAFRWDGKNWHPDGELMGANDEPIVIDGLWGIEFGGGVNVAYNDTANKVFYTAGPDDESGGAFGTTTPRTDRCLQGGRGRSSPFPVSDRVTEPPRCCVDLPRADRALQPMTASRRVVRSH